MATKYAVATGNWSAIATWSDSDGGAPGAAVPADGDTVVVCAAVTLTVDVNLSGWTTGLAGLTIRGGTTPGMLAFKSDADGTYYLRMKVSTSISGTLSTNRGRLFMAGGTWAAPQDAAFGRKMVIEFLGATPGKILATNLDIIARATLPAIPYMEVAGDLLAFTADPATDLITVPGSAYTNGAYIKVRSSGTLPAPLRNDILYYIRGVTGQPTGLASGMGTIAVDITSAGTGTHEALGHLRNNVTTAKALTDVTGDPYWSTSAPHNAIAILGATSTFNIATLSSITATDIGFSPGKASTFNAPHLCLLTRNVAIRNTSSSADDAFISFAAGDTHGAYIGCELRNLHATVRTWCRAVEYGANVTFGPAGLIVNCLDGFRNTPALNCQGMTVLCAYCWRNCDRFSTFAGTHLGCTTGLVNDAADAAYYGATLPATFVCCGTAVNTPNPTFTGRFSYGNQALGGNNATSLGIIDNTTAAVSARTRNIILGGTILNAQALFLAVENCQTLPDANIQHVGNVISSFSLYIGGHAILSGFMSDVGFLSYNDSNTELTDLWLKDCTDATRLSLPGTGLISSTMHRVRGRRVRLQNVTGLVRDYKYSANPLPPRTDYGRYIFDPVSADGTPNPGYLLCWTQGGIIATEAYNVGAHGTPPVPVPFVHVATFEDSGGLVHVEVPFAAVAGQTICTVVRHKVTSLADWSAAPTLSFEDAALPPLATGRVLASTTLTIADTDWHTSTLTYTPTITRPLVLRMQGQGGNASGTGTGKLYWHHTDPADVAAPLMYSF